MLSIMDGATNSEHRRVFLLTTNSLYINDNLLQRPGRIRYLKTFKDLTPEIIEEIVDDFLIYKEIPESDVFVLTNSEDEYQKVVQKFFEKRKRACRRILS